MIAAESGVPDSLTLAPHPTSPARARRHIATVLESGPMADLMETASLLVSEVVTNAVIHAATDIELTCRVERGSVAIEVRDRSLVPPSPRHYGPGASTGRGLALVELLADDWGVDADASGKTVWFRLAGPSAASAEARASSGEPVARSTFDVRLENLPVDLVVATIEYGDAVLREVVLLSIATHPSTDLFRSRPASTIDLGPLMAKVEEARRARRRSLDLVLAFADGSEAAALERLALVDEADRMARDGELLTPPAVPEIGACRRWLFREIGLQAEGAQAVPWSMPEPMEPVVGAVPLGEDELRRLDARTVGTVVADTGNRILYVNAAGATLLGWEGDELVGRRLVTLVPHEHRAAHLAGFTRYLLSGEARILGERTRLPALRRDGTTVELDITIEMVEMGGRQVFRATLA